VGFGAIRADLNGDDDATNDAGNFWQSGDQVALTGGCPAGNAVAWEKFAIEVTTADVDCDEVPAACGDGSCNGSENCASCAADCGACPSCGDGSCNGTESCTSCATDCGVCPDGTPVTILSMRNNLYVQVVAGYLEHTAAVANAEVFERVDVAGGFKLRAASTGQFVSLDAVDELVANADEASATVFAEYACGDGNVAIQAVTDDDGANVVAAELPRLKARTTGCGGAWEHFAITEE
jgi:hypothetical protein